MERWLLVCSCCLQSGQSGEVWFFGLILFRYVCKNGDFPVRSCARVRLIGLGSFSSDLSITGAC